MKVIVSLSGGMDSATVLAEALFQGHSVDTVLFKYGSKHNEFENKMAQALAEHYKVHWHLIDLSEVMEVFKSDLLLTGGEIPEGHYEDESMSRTVVPGRNIIFTSVLAGFAWSKNFQQVWVGIHTGDHAIYPDCRPGFYFAMKEAIEEGTDKNISLSAPFLNINKAGILARGLELGVPYELTRTCYKYQGVSCGKCGSCTERLEAFTKNGLKDPIPYE